MSNLKNRLSGGGGAWGLVLLLLCAASLGAGTEQYVASSGVRPPAVNREYRGAWVATVNNIDWPSAAGLSTADQKAELVAILERAQQLKLNAVIFQVRPGCDALYPSKIEPWSEYLTGTMGKAPEPYYDPLAFAIKEAHQRGLELHAWFNPYRARHAGAKASISSGHISKTHPELVKSYGKSLWLDPGEKAVQDYSLSVVMDVVARYDVDGVHFDDYFYPYKEDDVAGKELSFPDDASWKRFGAGGKLSRDDWRRENVNVFIQRVYQSIKGAKPWVKFGVSPFGIWRPGSPAQIKGYDAYEQLYADSRKWLQLGWCDYFAPQLYWAIEAKEQSFPVLLKWWAGQNPKHRLLLAGINTAHGRPWTPEEIINQIRLTRKQPGVAGHVHWNMGALMRKASLQSALEAQVYGEAAIPPALSWLDRAAPEKPLLSAKANGGSSKVSFSASGPVALFVIQTRSGGRWKTEILPGSASSYHLENPAPDTIAVTAVDRYGNASRAASLVRR